MKVQSKSIVSLERAKTTLNRPVGSGGAWRRSPHQNMQGERERERKREGDRERERESEREGREGRKERREELNERNRRARKERERERRGRGTDVFWVQNIPLELSKNYKRHGNGEAVKRRKKRPKRSEKKMTDERFEI